MKRIRTAELAKLAEREGFTPSEFHRCMMDGCSKFLRSMASGQYDGGQIPVDARAELEMLAAVIEQLNVKLTFLDMGGEA